MTRHVWFVAATAADGQPIYRCSRCRLWTDTAGVEAAGACHG